LRGSSSSLGTVTVVLAVGARLAARTGFSSIPLYLVAGIVLGALAPPTLDDALVTTLSEVGVVLLLFTLGLEYSALRARLGAAERRQRWDCRSRAEQETTHEAASAA
jgi:Kef-type K+ transport system membrane component KefB